jgi:hypothetical protein
MWFCIFRWRKYRDNLLDFIKTKGKKENPVERKPSTFESKIKKQRRASCGYAVSDCSSDDEPSAPLKKKGKDGYTAVPTTEPSDLEDIALGDSP